MSIDLKNSLLHNIKYYFSYFSLGVICWRSDDLNHLDKIMLQYNINECDNLIHHWIDYCLWKHCHLLDSKHLLIFTLSVMMYGVALIWSCLIIGLYLTFSLCHFWVVWGQSYYVTRTYLRIMDSLSFFILMGWGLGTFYKLILLMKELQLIQP